MHCWRSENQKLACKNGVCLNHCLKFLWNFAIRPANWASFSHYLASSKPSLFSFVLHCSSFDSVGA